MLETESAKSAAYYAGWCAAELNDELPSVASLAKAYCSEAYFHAAAEKGLAITLADYARAYEAKSKLARDLALWHETFDLLLAPVTP